MASDVIFVYGTLRSEFENEFAQQLRASAEFLGKATVKGSIYRVAHYPGYRESPAGRVLGELYRLRDGATILARLDEYEGEEYERVMTPEGWWIYRYIAEPRAETRIESGDFLTQTS
jgi:gamma-glutamylcyclotransferase (GGCT)/AIG2-like uncharacterized protein YtfP